MTTIESYSPVERFLLLETLHPFDSDSLSFTQASETLKVHDVLQEKVLTQDGRLDPESLQNLYLGLVKEEAKLVQSESTGKSTPPEPPCSPHLATIADATQYNHLLPRLLNRLYFGYRDHAIQAIEDEERNIKQLRREIEDAHRAERVSPSRKSSIQTLLRHDTVEDRTSTGGSAQIVRSPHRQNGESRPTSADNRPQTPLQLGEILPSAAKLPPLSKNAPLADSHPKAQPDSTEPPPFVPPSQQPLKYATGPPASETIRRPSLPSNASRPNLAPSPSPRLNQGPSERSSASPIILPPPPGMRHPSSPQGPLDALAEMAGQQYRARPPVASPRSGQTVPSQHPPQYPVYQQGHMQYSYYDARAQYPGPYQQYSPSPAAQYSNHPSYSPYQAPIQSQTPGHPYANMPPYPPPVPQYPQYSTYGHPQYYPQTPRQSPFGPPAYPASAQQTPQATASGKPKPPRPSPIITPASSTRWKKLRDPASVRSMASPTLPSRDEISPISDHAPSPPPEPSATEAHDAPSIKTSRSRTKSSRRATARPQPRKGSTTSNTRTRSQSLTSPATEAIKPEPPATPAASEAPSLLCTTAEDTARRSTRRRRDTMRGREMAAQTQRTAPYKRKRASTQGSPAPTPSAGSTPGPMQGRILATRNFPRTSATIMNDITSHKLTGMFARPLTEKEAPGHKDLIYRSQDLKSIKSAIAAGARALTVAESAEDGSEKGGGTSVLVNANPELIPPKGIVNSAQLEKELMRMFANAVMFNPDAKRSVGPAFNTRRKAAENHIPAHLRNKAKEVVVEVDDEEDEGSEVEGGLVNDAREMCEAVEGKVEGWRQAERAAEDRDGVVAPTMGERTRSRGGEEGEESGGEEVVDEEQEVKGVEKRKEVEKEKEKEKETTPTAPSKRRRR